MNAFWTCFVPLFVAVDALGVLPLFLGLTAGQAPGRAHRVILESVLTALLVSLVFLAAGTTLLRLMGITSADFMVAGGLALFALALTELLTVEHSPRRTLGAALGAVPIGVPLLAGPAVFASSLLLLDRFGFAPTALALTANMILAGLIFWFGKQVIHRLGAAGVTVLSKVANLFLAAISVMMIRQGVLRMIAG